jgi:hypothetical protein
MPGSPDLSRRTGSRDTVTSRSSEYHPGYLEELLKEE